MDPGLVQYLEPFLSLDTLNVLIRTSKIFSRYRYCIRKFVEPQRRVWRNTNNQIVKCIDYTTSGQVSNLQHYKRGQYHGLQWRRYTMLPSVQRANFRYGKLHGQIRLYYEQRLVKMSEYQNGQRHGSHRSYWWNQLLSKSGNFEYDQRVGPWYKYYGNGNLASYSYYKHGQIHGPAIRWDLAGNLLEYCDYVAGCMEGYREWHDGSRHIYGMVSQNCWNGPYEEWNEHGRRIRTTFVRDHKHGLYEEWHNNGKLLRRCTYHHGRLMGHFYIWNKRGQLVIQRYYDKRNYHPIMYTKSFNPS